MESEMQRVLMIGACAAVLLVGCGKKGDDGGVTGAAPAAQQTKSEAAPLMPRLAYRHRYEMQLPGSQISPLMSEHERACLRAGPSLCQVTGLTVRVEGGGDIHGALNLRAVPTWLDAFRDGLKGQAEAAHGKLLASETDTEDLTTRMVDTDAEVRAKIALRDRLQALVAHHDGKLKDLVEIENQLAQVQGEIDAARSGRAVMSRQVAMSDLAVEYRSTPTLATSRTWTPVGAALRDSSDIVAAVLAFMIRATALLGLPAIVGLFIWRSSRRKTKVQTSQA
jgi:hypothetical protein